MCDTIWQIKCQHIAHFSFQYGHFCGGGGVCISLTKINPYLSMLVIHSTAFYRDCNEFLYSNVLFLATGFYCGFDRIIYFKILSIIFRNWSNAKMDDATRNAKKTSFHKYHFHSDTRSTHGSYKWPKCNSIQCQLLVWRNHFCGILILDSFVVV